MRPIEDLGGLWKLGTEMLARRAGHKQHLAQAMNLPCLAVLRIGDMMFGVRIMSRVCDGFHNMRRRPSIYSVRLCVSALPLRTCRPVCGCCVQIYTFSSLHFAALHQPNNK